MLEKAGEIGFPVLIKAAGGGRGRGMRMVLNASEFAEAVAAARREATPSFGDDTLILERFLDGSKHVEVQIIADNSGNILSLGERECSIQRRYQKVIEESPSLGLDEDLRRRMVEAALSLATAAGYSNAGTVEYLLAGDAFYFLEVNPRLQVEHPVTEWTTGLDLVRLQLLVADRQSLPLKQQDVAVRGHSIEARIYSEDPRRDYLPDAGVLSRFAPPTGPWIRNDVGVFEGYEVPIFYDSLLAKLTVYGQDRPQAVQRLGTALDRYSIQGVTTNLPLLRAIVEDPEFVAGHTDTQFVARRSEPRMRLEAELPSEVLLSATAYKLHAAGFLEGGHRPVPPEDLDPWQIAGPWRLGRSGMEFRYDFLNRTLTSVASLQPGTRRWRVSVEQEVFELELGATGDGRVEVRRGGERWVVEASQTADGLSILWNDSEYLLGEPKPASVQKAGAVRPHVDAGTGLDAPMPGIVVQVRVSEGQEVSARQVVIVLEAMKIEHLIVAPYDGTVRLILCQEGQQVNKGATLMELEPR